ncbi:MAG: sulfite exporter TauE/SafE family protein [Pseudomonadota bacterium]|nr:sulfite exporter TauE/SafE family protein [Pseudomonadota bacterium]
MIAVVSGAFAAGLLGSPHCVGMCGAFATASADRLAEGAAWQVGRLGAYVILGAAAGAAGASLPVSGPVAAVVAALLLGWFSLRLAGLAPPLPVRLAFPTRIAARLLARRGILARLGFGALTALLPCGLLWSALAVSAASGGALWGALSMTAFWLGTVPALAVASRGLRLLAAARPALRVGLAGAVFLAGMWSIGARAVAGQAVEGTGEAPHCH